MKIGFIGLGIMGAPMAGHLIRAGTSCSSTPAGTCRPICGGDARARRRPRSAEKADMVITMVPDTPDVETVLFGPRRRRRGSRPGKTVVDMSSISPVATKAFARKISERGGDYLDAPVSGGEVGAKAASLTIMVGGPPEAFARGSPCSN